jgi:hypothetical protein
MESDLPGCVVQNSQIEYGLNTAPGDRVAQHRKSTTTSNLPSLVRIHLTHVRETVMAVGFEDCTQGFLGNAPVFF